MTSINVIRFNETSGLFIGDESISTAGDMNLDVSDKIQPIIPRIIMEKYGVVGALGATGSCSVGAEMKTRTYLRLQEIYNDHFKAYGKAPDTFMGIPQIMELIYDEIIQIRKDMIDAKIQGRYGFNSDDFNQGFYQENQEKILIKNPSLNSEITDWLVWRHETPEVKGIYANAGIFGGYDEKNGFLLYNLDFREGYWHEVQTCYRAEGSGRHSVDPHMYDFVENLQINERRGNINPTEGTLALLNAVNQAAYHEIGIGGYFNLIFIDGKAKKADEKLREINDERAYLGQLTARAQTAGFLKYDTALSILDMLYFKKKDFDSVYKIFMDNIKPKKECLHYLRGYKTRTGKHQS